MKSKNISFNDEYIYESSAKAAMYAANKKVMLAKRKKLEKEQWEKEMEQYNIQKAQFEKELKEKKEKELKKYKFSNHITLYFHDL